MHSVVRSGIVAAIATVVVAVGLSGCKSSGSNSGAKATPASTAGATTASSATAPPPAALSGGSVGSGAAASGGSVKDPCVLVTASDVGAVLNASIQPSTSEFTGVSQACPYTSPEDSAGAATVVNITDRLIDKAGFEASIKQNTGAVSPLPDVCQDAYVSGSKVLAWKDGTEVDSVIIGMPAGGDAVAAGTKLVTDACAKL
jgi:hypothetical protein